MWTAPAHSTQQKQSHLALPNGRDGLLCLLTGNGAPSVCRMNKLWKNWAIWEWSMKRGERESWPIACFLGGWLAGRSPRQLAHKEDERPAPTHSSLLAKKSNPFFAAGALRPAKKWSCLGVWVKEWGAANESMKLICFLFFFGWIKGCPQPLLRTKKKTKRKQID